MSTVSPAPSTRLPARRRSPALTGGIASEWLKLWSVRSTWWALISGFLLMGGCAAIIGMDFVNDLESGETAPGAPTTMAAGTTAAGAALLAQFAALVPAMLTITAEFGTGAMRGTLTADPNRGRVLFAKTAVILATVLPLSLALALTGTAVGGAALGDHAQGGVAADITATTVYLATAAVFTLGVGAVLRSSVATLSTVLGLLLALPMLTTATATDFLPGACGMYLLDPDPEAYGRATAGLLFAGWALVAWIAGCIALRRRDV